MLAKVKKIFLSKFSYEFKKRVKRYVRPVLNVFVPSRLMKISLKDCLVEDGHTYGPDGTHFFINALRNGEDLESIKSYLRDYYKSNHVQSFNMMIGSTISSPEGERYFLPWEDGRIRDLKKFELSHKAGPTSEEALDKIAQRLFRVLNKIKDEGFKQRSLIDGIIRVTLILDKEGNKKYLINDGHHRLAVASYLGIEKIYACYNSVYDFGEPEESIIKETEVESWPKVSSNLITKDQALVCFDKIFKFS